MVAPAQAGQVQPLGRAGEQRERVPLAGESAGQGQAEAGPGPDDDGGTGQGHPPIMAQATGRRPAGRSPWAYGAGNSPSAAPVVEGTREAIRAIRRSANRRLWPPAASMT